MNKLNTLLTTWASLLILLGMTASCSESGGGCGRPGIQSSIEDTWEMTKMEITTAGKKTVHNHLELKRMGIPHWTFTHDGKLQSLCDETGHAAKGTATYRISDKTLIVQSPADLLPLGTEVLNFSIAKLCPLYLRIHTKVGDGDSEKEWYLEFSRVKQSR